MTKEDYESRPRPLNPAELDVFKDLVAKCFPDDLPALTNLDDRRGFFTAAEYTNGNIIPLYPTLHYFWTNHLLGKPYVPQVVEKPQDHIRVSDGQLELTIPIAKLRWVDELRSFEHVVGRSYCLIDPLMFDNDKAFRDFDEYLRENVRTDKPKTQNPFPLAQVDPGSVKVGERLQVATFNPLTPESRFDAVVFRPGTALLLPRRIVYLP